MAAITLAKALKMKNRLVKRVAELQQQISQQNSTLVGTPLDYDSAELYEMLKAEKERLVLLKSQISAANAPIQETIYRMAELKGLVSFLTHLDTKRGPQIVGYGTEDPQEYVAQIAAAERDTEVKRLEREIDDLQDRLDSHNASVRIEFDEE